MNPVNALPAVEKVLPDAIKYHSETAKESRQERSQTADKISLIMSDLHFNAARYLDIRLIGDKEGLNKDLLDTFDNALRAQQQLKYLIPEDLQSAISKYMDATYENIRYWKRRWEVEQGYTLVQLSYDEIRRELPNIDQTQGKAGKAFDELQKSLKKYKQGPLKQLLSRLVIRLEMTRRRLTSPRSL